VSFQAVSPVRALPPPSASRVPPTAVTNPDTAGNDSDGPATPEPRSHVVEPESPAATNDDVPTSALIASTLLIVSRNCGLACASAMAQPP
jgi:hypothetical protein